MLLLMLSVNFLRNHVKILRKICDLNLLIICFTTIKVLPPLFPQDLLFFEYLVFIEALLLLVVFLYLGP